MLDEIRKKVLLDIFAAPIVLAPMVLGLSILLLSWAVSSSVLFFFLGFMFVIAAIGVFLTRIVFGLENLTENAAEYIKQSKEQKFEQELDDLDELLVKDRDARDQSALRELRIVYNNYKKQIKDGNIPDTEFSEKVRELFNACVVQLRKAYAMWETARHLNGDSKKRILDQREKILEDVLHSAEEFGKMIEEFYVLHLNKDQNLLELKQNLAQSLEVAKKTEKILSGLDKGYTEEEFLKGE